jgi:phosphatidylglycerophosphate synthase
MSMLYAYKPLKDAWLSAASRVLLAAGVTPNMVTVAGLIFSATAGLVAMSGHLYAGIAIFIVGACLDAFDCSLARYSNRCTEFGKYFDSVADRCSELFFVTGAVIGGTPLTAFSVVTGSVILLAARVYNHRKGRNSNAAMFGRPERLGLLIVGLLASAPWNTVLFGIAGCLCTISAAQALAAGIRENKNRPSSAVDPNITG